MPFVYTNGATTAPILYDEGQWYTTNNATTWATDTVTIQNFYGQTVFAWDPVWDPVPDRERAQQRDRERRQVQERQNREANEAAKRLLLSLLSPENQRRLEARATIRITGSDGGQYEIETTGGTTGNIIRRAGGRDTPRIPSTYRGRLCCHPRLTLPEGQLPHYDAIGAQVLMLENDEPAFLTLANIYH